MRISSQLFLRFLSFCYLAQFVSLLSQWRGIQTISSTPSHLPPVGPTYIENLLVIHKGLGIDVVTYGELILAIGSGIAVLGCFSTVYAYPLLRFGIFVFLFLIFQTVYTFGDLFLHFQWDILLLEAGWIGILLSCMCTLSDHSTQYLVRYLCFKLLFSSGMTKLTAECGTTTENQWINLTANELHFATQPIPSIFSWSFHNLPPGFLRLSVAITLWLETFGTLPFLLPRSIFPTLTHYITWGQIYFQILIMITGNYNFFNLLTIVLCMVSLPSTSTVSTIQINWFKRLFSRWTHTSIRYAAEYLFSMVYVIVSWFWMFQYDYFLHPSTIITDILDEDFLPDPVWQFPLSIRVNSVLSNKLTRHEFLTNLFPWILFLVTVGMGVNIVMDLYNCFRIGFRRVVDYGFIAGLRLRLMVITGYYVGFLLIVFAMIILTALSSSYVLFVSIHQSLANSLPKQAMQAYEYTSPYHLTNAYGLFRCMTGMGPIGKDRKGYPLVSTARPEIILEGFWPDTGLTSSSEYTFIEVNNGKRMHTNRNQGLQNRNEISDYRPSDTEGQWIEIPWFYKPGDVYKTPFFNLPHQPRTDWQMWFAALASSYQHSPWLVHLATLVLEGSPSIMGLLDAAAWPQKIQDTVTKETFLIPPIAIRAKLYRYDFTRIENIEWGEYRHHPSNSTGGTSKLYHTTVHESRPVDSSPLLQPVHPMLRAVTQFIPDILPNRSTSFLSSEPWWRREVIEPNFLPVIQQGDALIPKSSLYNALTQFGWENSVPQIHREQTIRSIKNRTNVEKYKSLDCSLMGIRSAKYLLPFFPSIREAMINYWAHWGIAISSEQRYRQQDTKKEYDESWVDVILDIVYYVPRLLNYVWYTLLGLLSDRSATIRTLQNEAMERFIPPVSHLSCSTVNVLRKVGLLPYRGFLTEITVSPLTVKAVQVPWWGDTDYGNHHESIWWIIVLFMFIMIIKTSD